jgi:predicted Zn-dependent protease
MRSIVLIVLLTVASQVLPAQNKDVVLQAMKDELQRNAKELSLPNFEKPFFIMYGLVDQNTMMVSATLGSILNSQETHNRYKTSTRVLVGNYEFNDESFEDNLFSPANALEISLPLDDDYWGIRRSFWATTDNVYRSAARHFEKHKQTLKETGKPLSELPHRWFGQVPAQQMVQTQPRSVYKCQEWEAKAKELSALFKSNLSISNSIVLITYQEGHKYLVNTEGLEVKLPFGAAAINIYAQAKDENGKFSFDQLSYMAKSLDKLPPIEQLKSDVVQLMARIEEEKKLASLEEEYNGPVLLEGMAVAQTLSTTLLRGNESIFASDNIAKLKGFQFDNDSNTPNSKIGKPIINPNMSVKVKPTLAHYNGVDLLGSFLVDSEGVKPPDELKVIENGILKNLLNNRTLTSTAQTANGFTDGPGVIEVQVSLKDSEKSLKEKLLARAKKEGLAFALILRSGSNRMGMIRAYKVDVATGKEQFVKNVNLREVGLKTWKRLVSASASNQAYNLGSAGFEREAGTNFTSWIVPSAILLEEAEVQPLNMPTLKEEEFITSPIKSN